MEKNDVALVKIVVVADGPTCTGFRLAGIQEIFPREGREAEAKIEELLGTEDTGIIITSEAIMEKMDWRLKKRIERQAKPVVIAVPDKGGPVAGEADSLKSQIKKALGFEIMA
ncbi:V-type ATP synthase subunit F [uncultured archaeon]|nr:V-type ATP synthase subunit F [uncultured archaeon]